MFFTQPTQATNAYYFFILQKFQNLIKDWPADLYSVQPIISAVQVSDQLIVTAVWGRDQPIICAIQATVQPIIFTLPIISALQAALQPMISTVQANVQPIISILRMNGHAVKSAVHKCSIKGGKIKLNTTLCSKSILNRVVAVFTFLSFLLFLFFSFSCLVRTSWKKIQITVSFWKL